MAECCCEEEGVCLPFSLVQISCLEAGMRAIHCLSQEDEMVRSAQARFRNL